MDLPHQFRHRVDLLLATEKTLAGDAKWQTGPYDGEFRWLSPLAIDGVTIGMNLIVSFYPRFAPPEYHINLIYEASISRLDFSDTDRHRNHLVKGVPTPSGVELGWLYGATSS